MISIIFRLLAWGGIASAAVMFFLNQENFVSFDAKIKKVEKSRDEASLALEIDKNKSSDLINGLFRERGKRRLEIEDALSNAEKLKEESELILFKEKDLNERNTKFLNELSKVREDFKEQLKSTEAKRAEGAPLREQTQLLTEELSLLESENQKQKAERDNLEAELSALKTRRDVATRTFEDEKSRLLNEIERPPYHYYGDEVEIDIMSVSPSGAGLFIHDGYKTGFRDDFKYLAYELNAPDRLFYLQAKLVQKGLTFLEFIDSFRKEAPDLIRGGQKLFLIRTGDSNTTIY